MAPEKPDRMTGEGPPAPPEELPAYLVDALESQSPDRLRLASNYALSLAGWKESRADQELQAQSAQDTDEVPDDWDDETWEDALEEAVDKAGIASTKGTITTKTINDNDYYYLQWRDGEQIKSQYVAPVSPDRE